MKKKELLAMSILKATPTMMRVVADNPPTLTTSYYRNRKTWKYPLFMRCQVINDILKVSFFLSEHMCTGGRLPSFELYIAKKEGKFITYDRVGEKWLNSKLDMIQSFPYITFEEKAWIGTKDAATIQSYLGVRNNGYHGLLEYQQKIRADELKRRHKRETDPWDADLKQVPPLPKDWKHWVSKVGIAQNYIYYQYIRKGATTGYCTYCEKDVPIEQPRHNEDGKCSCCRRPITFKSIGKAGPVETKSVLTYLIQKCSSGFIIRMFECRRYHPKGAYKSPICHSFEVRRTIDNKDMLKPRAYHWGLYKQVETRWIRSGLCSPTSWHSYTGRVYGKTLPHLAKNQLRETGLCETISRIVCIDPERYLAILAQVPLLEQLAKANLPKLTDECLSNYYEIKQLMRISPTNNLTKVLGLNGQELKRLRENNGGCDFLKWLQYEKDTAQNIPNGTILWLCKEKIEIDALKFIRGKMNLVQVQNYIERQMLNNAMSSSEVITTWSDYLSMAIRLNIDTSDEIVYRVRKLRQRHDDLVARCQEKDITIQAGEIIEKYPQVDNICRSLEEKYGYMDDEYAVVAPTCIEEIILEGRNLHHCAADSDRYWDRIERKEAFVLFLRKANELEQSYYTLEIEPNGTVRQKRTMYDRQNADIESATKFLSQWQKVVAERITDEDRELSVKSRVLRNKEFTQLRHDKVIIHTGDLRGKLLVDVLIADLMENAA